ncbi:cytochrome P450 family protein [Sorangium sp. So ce693]|uniref:cytochrome P450 family protein n=1 Tax=Sorangium sp. So ce693 TaxID=3133318 RepID=UPI003F60AF93
MTSAVTHKEWSADSFDALDPAFVADPYPFYARLRAEAPVHFVASVGEWWITKYSYAKLVLADKRLTTQREKVMAVVPRRGSGSCPWTPNMMELDPPEHDRVRALVGKAFTREVVQRLRSRIEEIAHELVDLVEGHGRMDVVADYAYPLPTFVLCELMGLPASEQEQFRAWTTRIHLKFDQAQPPEVRQHGEEAYDAAREYLSGVISERQVRPGADLISALISADDNGDRLALPELLSNLTFFLYAGFETTARMISAGVYTLLSHPDQLTLLRGHPELTQTAVEELLRYTSPGQRGMERWALTDLELGGKQIHKGDRLSVVLGAANRDPEVFPEPDRLDITRRHNPHLVFARGTHACLGSFLAITELEIAFSVLLRRLPRLELATPEPTWEPNTKLRGMAALHVRF